MKILKGHNVHSILTDLHNCGEYNIIGMVGFVETLNYG